MSVAISSDNATYTIATDDVFFMQLFSSRLPPNGDEGNIYGVGATLERDTVTNTGVIVGNVYLQNGADFFDGRLGAVEGRIFAGDGADVVYAGAGDDYVDAGTGADEVLGMDGNDTIVAENSTNTNSIQIIRGGAGDDDITVSGQNKLSLVGRAMTPSKWATRPSTPSGAMAVTIGL